MKIVNCLGNISKNLFSFTFGHFISTFNSAKKFSTFAIFHNEIDFCFCFIGFIQLDKIGMIKFLHKIDFHCQSGGLCNFVLSNDLNCSHKISSNESGFVNFSKGSLSNFLDELISTLAKLYLWRTASVLFLINHSFLNRISLFSSDCFWAATSGAVAFGFFNMRYYSMPWFSNGFWTFASLDKMHDK